MITEAEAIDWVAAYGDAWMTREPDRIVRLFTPDATYRERRFRAAIQGADAIRSYWQDLVHDLQRDVHFQPEQIVVAGNQAFVHWSSHFSWRPINGILELDAFSRVSFSAETRDGVRLATTFEEWIESREG